ncbi:MAG TPA: hypothetical protein VEV45_25660 [Streptosporangiaceae bacterium]|nr:hypothetical protein [Streptosporangiaceae bacterium]
MRACADALRPVERSRRPGGYEVEPTQGIPANVVVVWTGEVDEAFRELTAADGRSHETASNDHDALLREPGGNLVEIVAKRS